MILSGFDRSPEASLTSGPLVTLAQILGRHHLALGDPRDHHALQAEPGMVAVAVVVTTSGPDEAAQLVLERVVDAVAGEAAVQHRRPEHPHGGVAVVVKRASLLPERLVDLERDRARGVALRQELRHRA